MSDDLPREVSSGSPEEGRMQRPREGRVLGGVCAAVAGSLGVDAGVVRLAAAVLALVSGGAAVLVYLIAWALIPEEPPGSAAPVAGPEPDGAGTADGPSPDGGDARAAWRAAGSELRTLASGLRPVSKPPAGSPAAGRSPVTSVDAVLTGVGERLRDPVVQESARRTAARLAAAVDASTGAVARGARRGPARSDSASGEQADRDSEGDG
jgi:phage shock protein PspC (stress-responsive transcriptional regulator)